MAAALAFWADYNVFGVWTGLCVGLWTLCSSVFVHNRLLIDWPAEVLRSKARYNVDNEHPDIDQVEQVDETDLLERVEENRRADESKVANASSEEDSESSSDTSDENAPLL